MRWKSLISFPLIRAAAFLVLGWLGGTLYYSINSPTRLPIKSSGESAENESKVSLDLKARPVAAPTDEMSAGDLTDTNVQKGLQLNSILATGVFNKLLSRDLMISSNREDILNFLALFKHQLKTQKTFFDILQSKGENDLLTEYLKSNIAENGVGRYIANNFPAILEYIDRIGKQLVTVDMVLSKDTTGDGWDRLFRLEARPVEQGGAFGLLNTIHEVDSRILVDHLLKNYDPTNPAESIPILKVATRNSRDVDAMLEFINENAETIPSAEWMSAATNLMNTKIQSEGYSSFSSWLNTLSENQRQSWARVTNN